MDRPEEKNVNETSGPTVKPPAIVLVEPQLGENIGAAARAMGNFGLTDLRIVTPRDGWPNPRAVASASGVPWVLDNARVYESTRDAIADLTHVFATTARLRDMKKQVFSPEQLAGEVHGGVVGSAYGVLFGCESSGLSNEDAGLADGLVTIPVNPKFASLNLAQSVLLIGYEWRKLVAGDSLGRSTEFEGPVVPGMQLGKTRLANKAELHGFFDHFESALDDAGFLWPPEKRPKMVQNLRNMFLRMHATEQDVKTWRGVVAALTRFRGGRR